MAKRKLAKPRDFECKEEEGFTSIAQFFETMGIPLYKVDIDSNPNNVVGSGDIRKKVKYMPAKPKVKRMPTIQKVEKDVLECIVGQDEQVRQIITAIYRAKKFKTIKSNILIIGASGTGKTETVKQIAERLNLVYTIEDATKYTKEGYYGADVDEMVYNLIENAKHDIERAKNGIIIIDEIDKKAGGYDNYDPSGSEVLKSLLKIIEGTTIKIADPENSFSVIDFDTKDLIIIFLGAFSGLDEIKDKRLNKKSIGFTKNTTSTEERSKSKFLKQDLIEYGMPQEFVGRIDTIVSMNILGKSELANILKNSKLSVLKKYEKALSKRGIRIEFYDDLYEEIAEEALTLDTGARELSNVVNYIFENIIYQVIASSKKYSKCQLLQGIVKDNTKFILS